MKASSIAHEMKNDRNSISVSIDNIIEALKRYGLWDELTSPDRTQKAYRNVPKLLETNKKVSMKIVTFMDTMLSEIEKKQFKKTWLSIGDALEHIRSVWVRDYAFVSISLILDEDICFHTSEDILQVVFDNLILNSIQQNEDKPHLNISISSELKDGLLHFVYTDDGKGLSDKYRANPRRILEVHETTRKNGHGLGMWILNNTVTMSDLQIKVNSETGSFT